MNRWLWYCIGTPFQSGMDILDRLLINKWLSQYFCKILNLATANINTLRSREQCIPPSRDVFCVGLFRINPSTAPKIRKLNPRPQLTHVHTHINAHEICSFGFWELIPFLSRVIKYTGLKNHEALNFKMWSLWVFNVWLMSMDCRVTTCLSRWYLKNIIHNKDVFGLYVTMKYTISMHVVHGCIPSTIFQKWVSVHNVELGNRCQDGNKCPWLDVVVMRSLIIGDNVPPHIPWG